jgi:hypothetical protein
MRKRGATLLATVALLATLAIAGSAQAGSMNSEKQVAGTSHPTAATAKHVRTRLSRKGFQTFALYRSTFLDSVADGISGWPLSTHSENDPAEWAFLFGLDVNTLGFTCITIFDPADWCYHAIFLGPIPTLTFISWFSGQSPTYLDAAIAIMTLTHEANHYKLYSKDEGRVNACALQQFPSVIDTYFQIHPTITQTVAVRKVVWRTKKVWVRRHGRRVRIAKRVRTVKVVYVQQTTPNPDYTSLLQAAQQFYLSQPAPYSTGTCW